MIFFASTPHPNAPSMETQVLPVVLFITYVLISFIRVAMYTVAQAKQGRLLTAGNTPPPWTLPPTVGIVFILSVLLLLYFQAWLYMMVVMMGISLFLLQTGRTVIEQFGLARLPLSKVVKWSFLVCGAVIFVEVPLSSLTDAFFTATHLPHPQQESVEAFRTLATKSQIASFLIVAVALSPLIEELFFRGFLLTYLKNRTTTWIALIISATIFAIAHGNAGAVVQLWVLGMVLGVTYEHSGSLLLPIGIHGCWNLVTALTLLFEKGTS